MRNYTDQRNPESQDQLWLLEHPPVFTLGQAGKQEHLLNPGNIPIIQSDRGGQVTYHGPGQLIGYLLLDLRRMDIGVKSLVSHLESAILRLLEEYSLNGEIRKGAPGVYIEGRKIASLGLRIRHGCSYHGISLNVNMDLEPFSRINPCGYPGLEAVQLVDLGVHEDTASVGRKLSSHIASILGYTLA
jgi:lipoyl(octanoyl) transferase